MLNQETMGGFSGTMEYARWSGIFPRCVATDGAMYVAENGGGGAYWLLDAIASYQPGMVKGGHEFQVWKLAVRPDKSAALTCEDGNGIRLKRQKIPYTDFDTCGVTLWVEFTGDDKGTLAVILLPSEH